MIKQHFTFGRSHRLSGREAFGRVFEARRRRSSGPLTVYALPNNLAHARLGISIGRPVGTAPKRNRIKRLLRESFRLSQHDLPACDFVVVVRPHKTLSLSDYQCLLHDLTRQLAL